MSAVKDNLLSEHAAAFGAKCTDGGDGCCSLCGVSLSVCEECMGVGFHRPSCDWMADGSSEEQGQPFFMSERAAREAGCSGAGWYVQPATEHPGFDVRGPALTREAAAALLAPAEGFAVMVWVEAPAVRTQDQADAIVAEMLKAALPGAIKRTAGLTADVVPD